MVNREPENVGRRIISAAARAGAKQSTRIEDLVVMPEAKFMREIRGTDYTLFFEIATDLFKQWELIRPYEFDRRQNLWEPERLTYVTDMIVSSNGGLEKNLGVAIGPLEFKHSGIQTFYFKSQGDLKGEYKIDLPLAERPVVEFLQGREYRDRILGIYIQTGSPHRNPFTSDRVERIYALSKIA